MSSANSGDFMLTDEEWIAINQVKRPRNDGTLEPGYVSLVISSYDRLTRYRNGIVTVVRLTPQGTQFVCHAAITICPVISGGREHTHLSRYCFLGGEQEWWIILPGSRILMIKPDEPLIPGGNAVAVFEIMPTRNPPKTPNLWLPNAERRHDISILGVNA